MSIDLIERNCHNNQVSGCGRELKGTSTNQVTLILTIFTHTSPPDDAIYGIKLARHCECTSPPHKFNFSEMKRVSSKIIQETSAIHKDSSHIERHMIALIIDKGFRAASMEVCQRRKLKILNTVTETIEFPSLKCTNCSIEGISHTALQKHLKLCNEQSKGDIDNNLMVEDALKNSTIDSGKNNLMGKMI